MPVVSMTSSNMDPTFSTKVKAIFIFVTMIKMILIILFSSEYRDGLFIPFVQEFLTQGGNPWEYTTLGDDAFPYPPFMLYVLSVFLAPLNVLGGGAIAEGILYGLPLLLSDLLITYILIKLFPWEKTEVFIFYFCSPIILFSTYMHGQLDIIPTAILFASIYLLTKKYYVYSALVISIAVSTKFHTIAVIPLMIIYLINQGKFKEALYFALLPVAVYLGFAFPYIDSSESLLNLGMPTDKQQLIFDSYISVGQAKVYLPIILIIAIYLRFAVYRKINADLLFAAIGTLFSIFLLLIEPAPGWFIWTIPFFTIFYIRYFNGLQHYIFYSTLSFFYLVYYLLFHQYDHIPLKFLDTPIITSPLTSFLPLNHILFTAIQGVLLVSIYQFYKNGIKSNQVYTMEQAFVLGIGGDSGAGKSTLIQYLKHMFHDRLLQLEGDGDHKWERGDENWQAFTHLDPKANLLHRQADQVSLLKSRKTIKRSDYDHHTGKFTEADKIKPKDFLVIAGLHPFYLPKMRKVIDLKIFLDLGEALRTSWKIQRDQKERGYTVEQVLAALEKRKSDSEHYIKPQKQFTDLIIRFFPAEEEKFENYVYHGRLGLEVEMNASIPLDKVIQAFQDNGYDLTWDYSQDLNMQYVRFHKEPIDLDVERYVNRYVTNSSELIDNAHWQSGYAGIIQFLILFAMSEIMQERAQLYA